MTLHWSNTKVDDTYLHRYILKRNVTVMFFFKYKNVKIRLHNNSHKMHLINMSIIMTILNCFNMHSKRLIRQHISKIFSSRKTLRACLILVPLLGVQKVLFPYRQNHIAYRIIVAIVNSYQVWGYFCLCVMQTVYKHVICSKNRNEHYLLKILSQT